MDKNSLAHTMWECKYHIVFAPKYRFRQVIVGKASLDGQRGGAKGMRNNFQPKVLPTIT